VRDGCYSSPAPSKSVVNADSMALSYQQRNSCCSTKTLLPLVIISMRSPFENTALPTLREAESDFTAYCVSGRFGSKAAAQNRLNSSI
jgi:hypothetical protein